MKCKQILLFVTSRSDRAIHISRLACGCVLSPRGGYLGQFSPGISVPLANHTPHHAILATPT